MVPPGRSYSGDSIYSMTRTPDRSPRSTSIDTTIFQAMQRRKIIRAMAMGFFIGVACTSTAWNLYQTDLQLRATMIINDHAAGNLPPVMADCDRSKAEGPGLPSVSASAVSMSPTKPSDNNNEMSTYFEDGVEYLKYKPIILPNAKDVPIVYNRTRYVVGKGVPEFDPSAPAVIVTKIHDETSSNAVEQMICLLTKAYNERTRYDIVVFSALPWSEERVNSLRKAAFPAKVSLVIDNPGLQTMVDSLTSNQTAHLLKRCNATSSAELTWYHYCEEITSTTKLAERLNYNWQAEFRAKHIWKHPALSDYKYMLWLDSDAFCTHVWQQDPIATMRRHDLVLLYDHFPQGASRGYEWPYKMKDAFGKVICAIENKHGTLAAFEGGCLGKNSRIKQLHGFFHVTNLDFYRSPPVQKWADVLIGDNKFSRFYDDQIGVTVPAAVLAGNRSWGMQSHGIYLDVVHNYLLDGLPARRTGGFLKWWPKNGNTTFPEASQCPVTIGG